MMLLTFVSDPISSKPVSGKIDFRTFSCHPSVVLYHGPDIRQEHPAERSCAVLTEWQIPSPSQKLSFSPNWSWRGLNVPLARPNGGLFKLLNPVAAVAPPSWKLV